MSIRVSPLVSDFMVLQRDKPFVVFGLAEPGAEVTVEFGASGGGSVSSHTSADSNGNWQVDLGSFSASSKPYELRTSVQARETVETHVVHDIVIGDVWLLSGQSNMELWLGRTAHNYPDVMSKSDNLLRLVKIPQEPKFHGPRSPYDLSPTSWVTFNPETAPDISSVGYFFARKLRERYGIPIGLVATAVGGTPIAAWLSRSTLESLGIDYRDTDKFADDVVREETVKQDLLNTEAYQKTLDDADEGLRNNWADSNFDDSDWQLAELTDFAAGSGAHWYRKTLPVPAHMAGRSADIYLGTAIDLDTVYINGKEIGTTYYRYPPRNYSFVLPADQITIAIRLVAYNGGGEFTPGKNRFIATDNGTFSLDGPWKRKTGCLVPNAPAATVNLLNLPAGLFNGMIAPLSGLQIKGVAWYQGESDTGEPTNYGQKLNALITSWREFFNDAKLPFLIQQLANWDYIGPGGADEQHHRNWEMLRNQQKVPLELENVGLSAGYDIGEWNDLHPQGKQIVGERLARLAYRIAYGELLPPNMFEQYHLA